ncbi:hypothetical protein H4R26_005760 [Coemansia thaxteri]|uniref:Uncharacterized protein n=1 Tax=Coemansia thaxteri TaxID=2663907 RepID=A0A9W8B724_9FUNG|nr:hypothetical protein H4R26_005760 [Coemansia thaxteri]
MTVYGETVGKRLLNAPEKLGAMRWAMLSSIPLTLILSRFQASMMYLPVTALLLAPRPLLMQWPMSPSLTLMALPAISTLYRRFWRMTLGRLEHRWESHVPPEQSIFTIQGFEMHADTPARGELLVLDQVANENEQQGFARADRNFEALIMLNGVSLRRTVVESLLLPAISSLCGTLIAKLPFVRSGLSQFSKAVLGGCAYFVVKDLVRIFYKYLLFRSRSSRYIKGRKRL